MMKRLQQSREDQFELLMGNQEQKVTIEQIKADKVNSDLGYMRAMIASIDKKVEEEGAFRVRNED